MSTRDLEQGRRADDPLFELLCSDDRIAPRPEFRRKLRTQLMERPVVVSPWQRLQEALRDSYGVRIAAVLALVAILGGAISGVRLLQGDSAPTGRDSSPVLGPERTGTSLPPARIASPTGSDADIPLRPDSRTRAPTGPLAATDLPTSSDDLESRAGTELPPTAELTSLPPTASDAPTAIASVPPPDTAAPTESSTQATQEPAEGPEPTAQPPTTTATPEEPIVPASPTPEPTQTGRPTTTPEPAASQPLTTSAGLELRE